MQNSARVNVLEASQDLVQKIFDVSVAEELVRFDHLGQIGLHQVEHHINFVKIFVVDRFQNRPNFEDLIVVQ